MIAIDTQKNETFKELTAKILDKKRLSHAYLIEVKAEEDIEQVIEFAKKILTSKIDDNLEKERIEKLIEKNNYQDYKHIKSDGTWIKKEQILEIKSQMSTKSLNNYPRLYLIEYAEELNKSSANTLLKFLEEPEENIYGILITKNRHQVIDTIVSRCQYIKLGFEDKENNNTKEYNEKIIKFVEIIETKKEKSIPYFTQFDQEIMNDRKKLSDFLLNVLLMYNDILYLNIGTNPIYYVEYKEDLKNWLSNNTINDLSRKILALNNTIERLKYNTNIKLMLDKLSINMSGCDIYV